ncbi:MAG: hypothetical protein HZB26_22710 [Candidatus Hydrogenedentes bacterium]|nr:hypothetical protein [Candidatus Hydrogenedentota bacterium]
METPTGSNQRPPRRRYFINKRYQGRFIGWLCFLAVTTSAATGGVVYVCVKNAVLDMMYRSHMPTRDVWKVIMPPLVEINLIMVTAIVVVAAVSVILIMRSAKRALRVLESDIRSVTTKSARPASASKPFGLDAHALAREGLCERMKPFVEVAVSLERMAARGRKALQSEDTTNIFPSAPEIEQTVSTLEEGCRTFQTGTS